MTYAFPFMNRFYGKSGLLNMIIFSVSALLIDGKCVMLLYFVVRVIPVKSGHGHFGQNQNKKIISRLKIVYINNILFIYTIFRTFSHQKTNLTEMTMTEFDRIFVVVKKSAFTLLITKIVVNVIYIYSATYSTVSCHFRTALLNKLPPFLNKQPKNVVSLQKKSSISAKYLSKLNILHSICIFFASSTKGSVTRASLVEDLAMKHMALTSLTSLNSLTSPFV